MRFSLLLFISIPLNIFAQDCGTTKGELDKLVVSPSGEYVMVKVNQKGFRPTNKIFNATTGQLVYKFSSFSRDPKAAAFGFTGENETGFWGNEKFSYQSSYGVTQQRVNMHNAGALPFIQYDYFVKTSSNTGYWFWKIALKHQDKEVIHRGTDMQLYFDHARGWGLLAYTSQIKNRFKRFLFLLQDGQLKVLKATFTNKGGQTDLDYLVFLPKTERIFLCSGEVLDMRKKELVKNAIFKYPIPEFRNARVSEDESTIIATADVNRRAAIEINTKTYSVVKLNDLSQQLGNGYIGKDIIALKDLRSFAYSSVCCPHLAVIIRNGVTTRLCDKDLSDGDNYSERIALQTDNEKPSLKKAEAAYNELLSYLSGLDWHFNRKAGKIMASGSSSWILYGTREEALDILSRQKGAIQKFIKDYSSFITPNMRASLEARSSQIDDAWANIPKN